MNLVISLLLQYAENLAMSLEIIVGEEPVATLYQIKAT